MSDFEKIAELERQESESKTDPNCGHELWKNTPYDYCVPCDRKRKAQESHDYWRTWIKTND